MATRPTQVWGILNVTPDSFSDGGRFRSVEAACAHARRMLEEGADVIDVGGESSRPPGSVYGEGAAPVSEDEERDRVLPVVEQLAREGTVVSIDTVKGGVAAAALAAGARIVNDVSGGSDPALLRAVAEADAELVLMHNRLVPFEPVPKVDDAARLYDDVTVDVKRELLAAVDRALFAGVAPERVWIDPGIGFAKSAAQSMRLLGTLDALVQTRYRVLVGASRKSWIAAAMKDAGHREPRTHERLAGSLAAATIAALAGCAAVRVHDVAETVQALTVAHRSMIARDVALGRDVAGAR